MLGVNIDEAWASNTLTSAPQTAPKSSKYTVPVNPQMYQGNEPSGYGGPQYNNQQYANPQYNHPPQYTPQYTQQSSPPQFLPPRFVPMQPPMVEQFGNSDRPTPGGPQYANAQYASGPMPQENYAQEKYTPVHQTMIVPYQAPPAAPVNPDIPKLKEQISQQSDTVTDCQREVMMLKTFIHQLKRELTDVTQRHEGYIKSQRRKKWMHLLCFVLFFLLFVVVIVLLVQLSQKVTRVLEQPLAL